MTYPVCKSKDRQAQLEFVNNYSHQFLKDEPHCGCCILETYSPPGNILYHIDKFQEQYRGMLVGEYLLELLRSADRWVESKGIKHPPRYCIGFWRGHRIYYDDDLNKNVGCFINVSGDLYGNILVIKR